MKKYLLALLFMPLFFCQCNPDENDTEQEGIHLSGRAYATGAKTEMTNQNGEGIISWSSEKTETIFSFSASPFAIKSTVSLVEVSPSTETML